MTDNEIKKALESEIHLAEYVDSDYCSNVNLEIIKSVLDLINRQQAEIDEMKHEREVLIEDIHYSADRINEQQDEIEKLERTISYLEGVCESTPDKVRVEAIKEFAEKLKEEINIRPTHSNEQNKYVCFLIDNLVKEMVGEE